MNNTRQARANSGNRIALGVLVIFVSLFCFLCEVRAFGGVGRMVYSFLVGFFGLAAYAYAVAGLMIGVAVTFNIRIKQSFRHIFIYVALLLLAIFALHIYTSSGHIIGSGYGEYLVKCYRNTNTAGGMLFGIAAFPLMKLITGVGALVVACVAFFTVTLIALLPTLRKNTIYRAVPATEGGQHSVDTQYKKPRRFVFNRRKKQPAQDIPDMTVPRSGQLYVAPMEGDPYLGSKRHTRNVGADGYSPIAFDPLFPNKGGAYGDEIPARRNFADARRQAARDFLFSNGDPEEARARVENAFNSDPDSSSIGGSYRRRQMLESKLGINNAPSVEGFIQSHRPSEDAPVTPVAPPKQPSEQNSFSYEELMRQRRENFGSEYGIDEGADPRPVAKPKRIYNPGSDIASLAQEAVNDNANAGLYGAVHSVNSGVDKRQTGDIKSVGKPGIPPQNMADRPPIERRPEQMRPPQPQQRPTGDVSARQGQPVRPAMRPGQPVQTGQPIMRQGQPGQPAQPVARQEGQGTQGRPTPQQRPRQPEQLPQHMAGGQGANVQGQPVRPDVNAQQAVKGGAGQPVRAQGVSGGGVVRVQTPVSGAEEPAVGVYKPMKGEPKIPSAFRNNAIDSQKPKEEDKPQPVEPKEVVRPKSDKPSQVNIDKNDELAKKKQEAAKARGIQGTQITIDQAIEQTKPKRPYNAPPLSLLTPPAPAVEQGEDYEDKKKRLIATLDGFKITCEVIDILVGPTFTMYKLKVTMPQGKRVDTITSLESDIAMKMEVESVRIIAPIPKEDAVGIEVPNRVRRNVNLSEIIGDPAFNKATDPATFALGKNLYGQTSVVQVSKLPHALIAGATGAGKSCCINSLIVSLLYKASPDEVRFILIDPKRVELSVYAGIPHLLMDEIICDADKAIRALNWACEEMTRRIKFFSEIGMRNIEDYNAQAATLKHDKMARIIIVVDEFADLMSTGKRAVEDTVNKLARLSRAVGIHLILATQRPSTDVISGTIKNNFPSRVAFKVTSSFDSKTVLDTVGAEKLLGYGDLFYMTPGKSELDRMQGAFISNEDVKKVVDYIKANNDSFFDAKIKDAIFKEPEPEEDAKDTSSKKGGAKNGELPPEVFDALRLGMELAEDHKPLSISMIQRKLGLGYPKAAKIYDIIDGLGYIVQDADDPKKRIVSITEEEIDTLKNASDDSED